MPTSVRIHRNRKISVVKRLCGFTVTSNIRILMIGFNMIGITRKDILGAPHDQPYQNNSLKCLSGVIGKNILDAILTLKPAPVLESPSGPWIESVLWLSANPFGRLQERFLWKRRQNLLTGEPGPQKLVEFDTGGTRTPKSRFVIYIQYFLRIRFGGYRDDFCGNGGKFCWDFAFVHKTQLIGCHVFVYALTRHS